MPQMLITTTCEASQDGLTLSAFDAGKVYDVTPHAAAVLLANGWAVPASDKPKEDPVNTAPIETKAAPAAPENKAAATAPENKTKPKTGKGR